MRSPPRFFRILTAALLLGCAWTILVRAAEKNAAYQAALESIRAEELGQQVGVLAGQDMEGRQAGTRGGRAAGDYLAEQYAALKLQGAASDGDFFQRFAPNFRNVLAMLEGGDPQLRDEVILVGAHYDHIGYGAQGLSRGPAGYIHPGADDNASGTAAVLELARAFTVLAAPPKRSILFAAWDAEEIGMLGSKYWTSHPTVPLERVKAAVNLDMVGWLCDRQVTVFGSRSGFGWRRLLCVQNESGLLLDFCWRLKPNADHYPFFQRDIPVLMFHTGLHDEYHRPSDTAERINAEGMQEVGRLLFGLLYELAERPGELPAFRAAARYETTETEKTMKEQAVKPADRLGVRWVEDAALAGGVRISDVAAGSPAERAGLRTDDLIVRFADRAIQSDDDFFGAVAMAEGPAAVIVRRAGEEEPMELEVDLPGEALRWGIVWRVDDAEPGAIILTHVVPGTPAAQAGLSVGDRIYQVAGRDFADEAAFALLAKTLPAPWGLLVERDGRLRTVVLEKQPSKPVKRAA